MNRFPKFRFLLPAFALFWMLLGVSFGQSPHYSSENSAPGGGYYVNQSPPAYQSEWQKRWNTMNGRMQKQYETPKRKTADAPRFALPGEPKPVPAKKLAASNLPGAIPPAPVFAKPPTATGPKKKWWSFLSFGSKSQKSPARTSLYHDSFWEGDSVEGSPKIRISLSEQRVFYYKGGRLVGSSPISSGREGNGTTTGNFRISQKDLDHKSSWYGEYVGPDGEVLMTDVDVRKDSRPPGGKFDGANMRFFMRINGPIGMHEGYLPGYPASHGCIRLPTHMAAAFFHATPLGTPVEIVR